MLRTATPLLTMLLVSLLTGCEIDVGEFEGEDAIAELNVASGGYEIRETSWAAVGVVGGSGRCTGTAITSRWVLTAAHCFDGWYEDGVLSASEIDSAYFDQRGGMGRLKVTDIVIHPDYYVDIPYNRWDIALMRVDTAMDDIIPISTTPPRKDGWFVAVGYGISGKDAGDFGTKRLFANQIDELDQHHYQYNKNTSRGTRPTHCRGDSGGPMMVYQRGWKVVAAISRSRGRWSWTGCHDETKWGARIDIAGAWIRSVL